MVMHTEIRLLRNKNLDRFGNTWAATVLNAENKQFRILSGISYDYPVKICVLLSPLLREGMQGDRT